MKSFADKQTLDDLNLLGKFKHKSVFGLFNQVITLGGEKILHEMFNTPLSNFGEINRRSADFRSYQESGCYLLFDAAMFRQMESFVNTGGKGHWIESVVSAIRRQVLHFCGLNNEYDLNIKSIESTNEMLIQLYERLQHLLSTAPTIPFKSQIRNFIYSPLIGNLKTGPYSFLELLRFNHLFRHVYFKEISELLKLIYQMDVCQAVAKTAAENNFTYALALPDKCQMMNIKNCRYPGLQNAVGNDIEFNQDTNMIFLTGANMAGKSTFMKAFGISCYLAHMGFPVPAEEMTFSVKEGLCTSINVPDNINLGHSHFYAEVLRVKAVAVELKQSSGLYIIFDELFKGTNVKDAFDATLAVTAAFAEKRHCFFIISTHIIEVGETLKKKSVNINFSYMPTVMKGNIPRYTYKLEPGITSDRHGMMIIENENILEILNDQLNQFN
jgi:DNA mismatch repair protein MutS